MITTNHKKIEHTLRRKGWEERHIAKTMDILKKHESRKHPDIKLLDSWLHGLVLFLILVGNIIVLSGLIPLMINMPQWFILAVASIVGFVFGLIIDKLLREYEITAKHYMIAGVTIPIMALLTVLFIIEISRKIAIKMGFSVSINPLLMVTFYIASFSAPHLIYRLTRL